MDWSNREYQVQHCVETELGMSAEHPKTTVVRAG